MHEIDCRSSCPPLAGFEICNPQPFAVSLTSDEGIEPKTIIGLSVGNTIGLKGVSCGKGNEFQIKILDLAFETARLRLGFRSVQTCQLERGKGPGRTALVGPDQTETGREVPGTSSWATQGSTFGFWSLEGFATPS